MRRTQGTMINSTLPPLIWLIALGAVVWLYFERGQSYTVRGLAQGRTFQAATNENGTVRRLPVRLYDYVHQGDILAVVEQGQAQSNQYKSTLLKARQATARAELKRLEAELESAQAQMRITLQESQDQYEQQMLKLAIDVQKANLDTLAIKTDYEPTKVELKGLELEKKITEQLLAKDAVEPYELQKIKLKYDRLAAQAEQQEAALRQAEAGLKTARERLAQLTQTHEEVQAAAVLLKPFAQAVEVQRKRLAELFLPEFQIEITAPFDGVVTEIAMEEGQTVMAGQPILTMQSPQADNVTVWLDPSKANRIQANQPIEIVRVNEPRMQVQSRVESVGPAFEQLPQIMWRNPTVPQWGRPAIIRLPQDIKLLSNEVVGVRNSSKQ